MLLLFKKTSKVTNRIQINQHNERERDGTSDEKNVQIYRPINIMVKNLNYQLLIEYYFGDIMNWNL